MSSVPISPEENIMTDKFSKTKKPMQYFKDMSFMIISCHSVMKHEDKNSK